LSAARHDPRLPVLAGTPQAIHADGHRDNGGRSGPAAVRADLRVPHDFPRLTPAAARKGSMEQLLKSRPEAITSPVPEAPGTSPLARPDAALPALTPRALEDRQLIHRSDSVRAQADAFRSLRTKLLALGEGRKTVILVTPVQPGCGGSFVARNLARSEEHTSELQS